MSMHSGYAIHPKRKREAMNNVEATNMSLRSSSALYTRQTCLAATLALSVAGLTFSSDVYANPQNATVTSGTVSISQTAPNYLTVTQGSDKAIINWQSFNILNGETTRFIQPSSSSVALNRITNGNPTQILGTLTANGQLMLVNGSGIFFGKNSQVNVAGLIASTGDISDANFKSGNYKFNQAGKADASIINKGTITAAEGGLVALLAPGVRNDGIITAKAGTVALGAGQTFTVDFYGDNLYSFAVDSKATAKAKDEHGNDLGAAITNSGTISAQGGTIYMTADAAKEVVNKAINTTGIVDVSASHMEGGTIVLDGGEGNVEVSGKLDASSKDKNGGTVNVLTKGGTIALASATVNASGATGGGNVNIGGGAGGKGALVHAGNVNVDKKSTINVRATDNGNGGSAVLWSDNRTQFYGTINAKGGVNAGDGGNVETSSEGDLVFRGAVDTTAPNGKTGNLLLDPTNITIASGSGIDSNSGGTATIYQTELENIAATTNISLLADYNITINSLASGNLNLAQTVGNNVTFSAGNGGITMKNTANTITTAGGALNFITSGGMSNLGNLNTGTGAITFSTGGTTNVLGVINTSGAVTMKGTGTLNLNNANTFTGGTNILSGTATANNSKAFGTGAITLGDGNNDGVSATLSLGSNNTIANAVVLSGGQTNTLTIQNNASTLTGGITGAGNLSISVLNNGTFSGADINHHGTIINLANALDTVPVGGTIISANIGSNVTGVIQNGNYDTLTLRGNNSFSGGVQINYGSVVGTANANAFGTGTITLGDGQADGKRASLYNGSQYDAYSNLTFANAIVLNAGSTGTLTVGTNSNYSAGAGFSGGITGNNSLVIANNGNKSFVLSGSINNGGTVTNTGTGTGTTTISGAIGTSVTGVTQKSSTSALTLSGTNTYTNATTVTAGTLNLGKANALSSSTDVTVGASGTFNLGGYSDTISSLTSNGAVTFGTGNTLTTSGAQTYNGTLTGNGITLASTGGGAISATNSSNNLTGNTNISTSNTANIVSANSLGLGTVSTGALTAQAVAGSLTLAGPVQATGDVNLRAGTDIIASGSNVTTQGGVVTLDSNVSGTGGAISLNGSSITTNGGNVTLGGGATPATGFAQGNANSKSTLNTYGGQSGININNSTINTGTGSITANGIGGTNAQNTGIAITGTSQLTTTSGNITLNGTGGTSANGAGAYGVVLGDGGTVTTATGAINVTGTGGAANGGYGNGVQLYNGSSITSIGTGTITLTGTAGGKAANGNYGVYTTVGNNIIGGANDAGAITITSSDSTSINNVTLQTSNNITLHNASGSLSAAGSAISGNNVTIDPVSDVTLTGGTTITAVNNLRINNSGAFSSDSSQFTGGAAALNGKTIALNQSALGSIQNAISAIGTHNGATLTLDSNSTWNEAFKVNTSNLVITGDKTSVVNASSNGDTIATINGNNDTISNITLSGNNLSGITGISATGDDVTIINNTVTGANTGISVSGLTDAGGTGNRISGNTIYGDGIKTTTGIAVDATNSKLVISGNTLASSNNKFPGPVIATGTGIAINNSSLVTVDSNTNFNNFDTGINVSGGSHDTINNNTIGGYESVGINVSNSSNDSVTLNHIITASPANYTTGILLTSVSDSNVGDTATSSGLGNSITGFSTGISLANSPLLMPAIAGGSPASSTHDDTINGNTVNGAGVGIGIYTAKTVAVGNNTLYGNGSGTGLYVNGSTLVDADTNYVYGYGTGIGVSGGSNNTLNHNTVNTTDSKGVFVGAVATGISANGTDEVVISNNTVTGANTGISVSGLTNNDNKGNSITGNTAYGNNTKSTTGIAVDATNSKLVISGNTLASSNNKFPGPVVSFGTGITINNSSLVAIDTNTSINNFATGINLSGGSNDTVNNNTIGGVGSVGINVNNSSNDSITLNKVTANPTGLTTGILLTSVSDSNVGDTASSSGLGNTITGFSTGISLASSPIFAPAIAGGSPTYSTHDVTIDGNTVNGASNGISIYTAEAVAIGNNTLYGNGNSGGTGIYINSSTLVGADTNYVYSYGAGIGVSGGSNNTIINNTINGAVTGIFVSGLTGDNNHITGNHIDNFTGPAINASGNTNLTINSNKIGQLALSTVGNAGIEAADETGLIIDGNTINGTPNGISLTNVTTGNNVVSNNVITGSAIGINVNQSDGIQFASNNVTGTGSSVGVLVDSSVNVAFSGDTFQSNLYGIELSNAQNTSITGVSLTNNTTGLFAQNGSGGTLVGSTSFSGGTTGVLLDGTGTELKFSDALSNFTKQDHYFVLQGTAMFGKILDASQQIFENVRASNFTQSQWAFVEQHTTDSLDGGVPAVGRVFYRDFPGVDVSLLNQYLKNNNPNFSTNTFSYATPPAFGDLNLLAPSAGGGSPEQFGSLSPAAGGQDYALLSPSAGGDDSSEKCGNGFLATGLNTGHCGKTNQ